MKKILGLVAMVAMLVVMAVPASAEVGVFSGNALVAQGAGDCGVGNGSGLGLPALNQNKNGSFQLITSTLADAPRGLGILDVCGDLTSVAGIGAACGMSKGYNGEGTVTFAASTVDLTDVGWKLSAGGTLPVIGHADDGTVSGTLVSLVQAQGAGPCLNKAAVNFTVAGVYAILTGVDVSWNDITDNVDPKNDGPSSTGNIWGDKK